MNLLYFDSWGCHWTSLQSNPCFLTGGLWCCWSAGTCMCAGVSTELSTNVNHCCKWWLIFLHIVDQGAQMQCVQPTLYYLILSVKCLIHVLHCLHTERIAVEPLLISARYLMMCNKLFDVSQCVDVNVMWAKADCDDDSPSFCLLCRLIMSK